MTTQPSTTPIPTDFPEPTLVALDDVELEVYEAGPRDADRAVVLCHGWPEHAYSWRHQVPALAAAGYHVIVPNQRGYGRSSCPADVAAYDVAHLTGDLVGLLDHYGHEDATFVGHDWGAFVVWSLAQLHPERVNAVVNLSLPYQERGGRPWVDALEEALGEDFYLVHLNRRPGVADAVLDADPERFLRNLFRTGQPPAPPQPGMALIDLARTQDPPGEPLLSDDELAVLVSAFTATGFTPSLSWYRNLDRNWHLLADADPVVRQPALMVYGTRDTVVRSERLTDFVPHVDVVDLDCGHWIQQELPEQATEVILTWLARHGG
ncbi:alpha/beta fold hydrolase [Cellulomonas fimi]|uniref:Alpha/beta hydrolase fold protein n=1 Tax=Cellulomonas fimi (strain ATCC 484 / DSM 20113 / JCM 1341 / CCUG 24087 / LMG 16345 / NBRC 15513 / NCIMB 8980 / NCTC 7547 / NRS-133) TaxID=590998 RepID=F4H7L5_CELFA|nr:alpha/beta hydrolase [Cellulomonas fimi]AEE44572.1 alpha/beta hydrolase fold protein [Cellulomonas fimi ATCC 484]VEH26659.1 Soluble epoxide hydrolase [Cellulomonas fimi]